jgi:O-antigen/teichoic acid export membrane protein
MGIVQRQSMQNTITTYLGFGIGAINILFLYTYFLTEEYFGLVAFVLSTANIMMPLLALGVHNTLVKYYSALREKTHKDSFLTLMVLMPLVMIVPLGLLGYVAYDAISNWLARENAIIKDYTYLIFIAAICLSYFEIFYAWAKVQLQSSFGNFLKEVFHRIGILLLFVAIYFDWIDQGHFIFGVVLVYAIRTLVMKCYAFGVRKPVIRFGKIPNFRAIIIFTLSIVVAGSVANIILEIDKFMIGALKAELANVAYYAVAIYIATTIGVPARSMHQITYPLTAQLINNEDRVGLKELYKKSSLNLFIISGLIFLLIVVNINQLYLVMPDKYSGGLWVVFIVGVAKLTDNLCGNSNSILFNSDHYRIILILGVLLALITVVLNIVFIPKFGIEGAAWATFWSIALYNSSKLYFIHRKFRMTPFSTATFKTILFVISLVAIFYFWEFPFHPIINIGLKSVLISGVYVVVIYWFNFSEDITELINKLLKSWTY